MCFYHHITERISKYLFANMMYKGADIDTKPRKTTICDSLDTF